jgi:hypothetical protein
MAIGWKIHTKPHSIDPRLLVKHLLKGSRPPRLGTPTRDDFSLPGHVKKVRPLDYDKIYKELCTQAERDRLDKLWRDIESAGLGDAKKHSNFTKLPQQDVRSLLDAQYIVQTKHPVTMTVFRRPEVEKNRARILGWPWSNNAAMDYEAELELNDVTEIVNDVSPSTFAVSYDLAIS